MTSCQCLTICKKLVFYLLKVYSFPKNYFNFWNILKKWHWFWPPPPPIKMSFLFTHSKFDFFLRPPPFLHNVTLFTDFFFLKSSLRKLIFLKIQAQDQHFHVPADWQYLTGVQLRKIMTGLDHPSGNFSVFNINVSIYVYILDIL